MRSLKKLYKIGRGPSSSHTMGPEKASKLFEERYPANSYEVVLYGSLALTGKGHGTDAVIEKTFTKPVKVIFDTTTKKLPHPNTMDFFAIDEKGERIASARIFSVGGGSIRVDGEQYEEPIEVYPQKNFTEIKEFCEKNNMRLLDYVIHYEGEEILAYFDEIWAQMQLTMKHGLALEGVLPGGLETQRKAKVLFDNCHWNSTYESMEHRLVCAYAFAVAEQNAAGDTVVTAPTCGACGILPAVLKYEQQKHGASQDDIRRALAAAGVIGNVVKANASISGAECGCQAECGTACSMAAAALAELLHLDLGQIEYAAEVAIEHNLGLTCDPVGGLVQIPCIERNAVTAMRALNAVELATFLTPSHKVSFDTVVATMYETGKDLKAGYRETSTHGLAKKLK